MTQREIDDQKVARLVSAGISLDEIRRQEPSLAEAVDRVQPSDPEDEEEDTGRTVLLDTAPPSDIAIEIANFAARNGTAVSSDLGQGKRITLKENPNLAADLAFLEKQRGGKKKP